MKCTIRFLILLTAAVAALANAASAPPPSIGVSPSRLEISVGKQNTMGSATVLNMSNHEITVKTSVVDFDLDENNQFRELEPTPGSLPTAMMVNPSEFTIPANGSQTVRFAIMPQRLEGEGEHRAMLFFSELVDTSHAGVKLNFRLGMPIYATVGEPNPIAAFNDLGFDAERLTVSLDISSVGNSQVQPTGYYLWWPLSDYPSEARAFRKVADFARDPNRADGSEFIGGRLVTKPVFAGTRRTVIANLLPPPDAGEYMLVLQVDAGGQQLKQVIEYAPTDLLIVDSD
jgi:hypothetical protein